MILKKGIALLLGIAVLLTACHSRLYNQTEGNIAEVKLKSDEALRKSNATAHLPPSLLVKQGMYVDTTPVSLHKAPEWLHKHIVIRGDQLPFSYYSRVITNGAGDHVLTRYQAGLNPAINVSMNYSGTIKGALEMLAAKTGYVYTAHRKSVYWQAFITKTFDIAFIPGSSDYLLGKKSGGEGVGSNAGGGSTQITNYTSSDSSDNEYSNITAKLSVWTDLENTIKQLLSPDGKVMVSEATTTVTVRDKPTNIELISQFIRNFNTNLARQVLVKIQVLELTLEDDFNYGINWRLIFRAFAGSQYQLIGNYGTPVSITPLTGPATLSNPFPFAGVNSLNDNPPSYQILINALNQQGKTSVVSEPRIVCLNNQVSVIRIVQQQGYVASVQNTAGVGGGGGGSSVAQNTVTSQVTPGNVITGLTLYLLPKILNGKIFMQVNADLSTLLSISSFPNSTNPLVQLPIISEKHFNQKSMINSGDTLILSGFKQMTNQTGAMQLLTSQALGGKAAQQKNTETIVLITPFILPGGA